MGRTVLHGPCEAWPRYTSLMMDGAEMKLEFVYWRDDECWLGYLREFPDYITQGESLEELQENLRDLYRDMTSGEIPGIRRVAELTVA